jgi:hypothetical protein
MQTHTGTADASRLPDSPAACRARLAALQDEIASIRLQIAATDMRRQAVKGKPDATAFHRAKTALRLKQQERARLQAHLVGLEPGHRRDRFKDALIEVLRAEFDDTRWASLLGRARALLDSREVRHG